MKFKVLVMEIRINFIKIYSSVTVIRKLTMNIKSIWSPKNWKFLANWIVKMWTCGECVQKYFHSTSWSHSSKLSRVRQTSSPNLSTMQSLIYLTHTSSRSSTANNSSQESTSTRLRTKLTNSKHPWKAAKTWMHHKFSLKWISTIPKTTKVLVWISTKTQI